jgi:hypothetical protein
LDSSEPTFDKIRLPLLISARSLQAAKSDFASSLKQAATSEMSLTNLGAFPDEFFLPYSKSGHRSWLIIVDGLDEIEDRIERQRIWDTLSRLHSHAGDSFQFIVFSRPNAVRVSTSSSSFQRWQLCSPSESDQKLIAHRYIDQELKAEQFITHLSNSSFSDIYQIPLFETIAASLFSQTGALPSTHMGLCEAFASALIEKSPVSKYNRDSVLRLLQLFAESTNLALSLDDLDLKNLGAEHTPQIHVTSQLIEIARKTGLVQFSGGQLSFIHDIFRSYFLALKFSQTCEPTSQIWRLVDPFRIGWATAQYICERWSLAGKDISAAVNALLSFGEEGETCAIEASIACSTVSEKVISKIVERIFREMYSTGATISGVAALTRLAKQRPSVKKRLIDTVRSGHDFLSSRLECAECLLRAGHTKEAQEALEFIADQPDEYHGDRIRAAELLLDHGQKTLARKVLHEMAHNADSLGMRADAASIIFVDDRSDDNRALVNALLNEEPEDDFDKIYESTISRLLSAGEKEIALPLMRNQAKPQSKRDLLPDIPRDEIAACLAIAAHHSREEAIVGLETLLSSPNISLRGKAEVFEALVRIDEADIARKGLQKAVGQGPRYDGADWFVLEMLSRLKLKQELEAVGVYLVQDSLNDPHGRTSVRDAIKRLADHVDHKRLAELIRPKALAERDTVLVTCLASLGFRNEATDHLKAWIKSANFERKSDAARALCVIGEGQLGTRILNQIVKNSKLEFDARLGAAHSLKGVGEVAAASRSYLILLSDTALTIEQRCNAAQYFEEENINNSEAVWEILFPLFADDSLPLNDRITAGDALLQLSDSEWFEFEKEDVLDGFFSILNSSQASSTEAWRIVETLSRERLTIEEIPKASLLVDDSNIPLKDRISLLQTFVIWADDESASKKLIEIAETPATSLSDYVEALSGASSVSEEAKALLDDMSRDTKIPAAWRLKAADAGRLDPQRNSRTIDVILDPTVTTNIRISSLNELRISSDVKLTLLARIATSANLNTWERLSVAKAALDLNATTLIAQLLQDALADAPHSIAELTEMAKLFHSIGQDQLTLKLLTQVLQTPDTVISEIDDYHSILEAAELLFQVGHDEQAKLLQGRLITIVGWYGVDDVLNSIQKVQGAAAASLAAADLLARLIAEANDPGDRYMGYWTRAFGDFLTNGWTNDLAPLLRFADNPSNLSSNRAEAALLIYQNASRDPSKNWKTIAHEIVRNLLKDRQLPVHERAGLVSMAKSCGLENLAKRYAEELIAFHNLTVADHRALAKMFVDLDDKKRAKEALDQISAVKEEADFLGPWTEKIIKDLEGEEQLRRVKSGRAFDENAPLFDRLLEARDIVSDYGDRRALQLIFDAAYNERLDPNERLQAIEVMEELGYRGIPRELLASVIAHPEVDDYWAGHALLQFGTKSEALAKFRRAVKTCPKEYRDQIARSLAELQATTSLQELNETYAATSDGLVS